MSLNTIEELLSDFRQGKIVIVMDDEDRENEGDLIVAASLVRSEDINFMARFGRGLICQTMTRERCQQLNLPLMVNESGAKHGTKFTVSIDAAHGITTGISAHDRALTSQIAAKPDAKPSEIVQPGHVFPLMAEPGGVLTRAGHTEAGCDLARLAGLEPTAVIVEILNEDGTMARKPDLEKFAAEHGLKIGTIADLIQYRMMNEKTVERLGECEVTNDYGHFRLYAYRDTIEGHVHLALTMGRIELDTPTLVRVHVADFLCDITACQEPDCGWPLSDVFRRIAQEKSGVILILRREEKNEDLIKRIQRYQRQAEGVEIPQREAGTNLRTHGLGAQILVDLGVRRMRVLSAPKKMLGISGFGLEVVEYVST
uniref:3,4-dihydroxy-2-butanone 4-phosphate synthase n=1 Tax=Candidatus Kentrum sp. LFY TaxID=2126342 RepID=A0A450U841_9GAMM|nr:MAG: GTP cyclohydrolase II /3,4-dihydroxy-2-butanone 4-phosphate synthase [Candidatus Kentron sp. LFY]VFJ92520.1 MAG: GTP cyclohydrolase II /3,4-dihydroxy-2-butanone 4-phosphate synthase [Candidatus Kentron sp. LFY]VFK15914.1 MAG: GTP cyclohydrolase II /3,4-dihydroxy-2-butanone 4-phosphate synthase [Candidatus Kentron sp. LFY]